MPRSLLARLQFAALAGLVLFAPDDGGAAGGDTGAKDSTGAGGASIGTAEGTPPPAPTDNVDPLAGLTAEQRAAVEAHLENEKRAAVNGAVGPKVAAREKQIADYLAAEEAAKTQTLEEKAATREAAAAAREKAADDRERFANAKSAALGANVRVDRTDALLALTDLSAIDPGDTDAIKAAVVKAAALYPEFSAETRPVIPGGASGADAGHQPGTIGVDQFKTMTYTERAKLATENPTLYTQLANAA